MGGWFLEAYLVMTNFRAKGTNSFAKTCSVANFSVGSRWYVYKDILLLYSLTWMNCPLIVLNVAELSWAQTDFIQDLILSGLSTEWLDSYWLVLNVAELSQALVDL